jgi:tetratricopeptide (TPR) repeat protein
VVVDHLHNGCTRYRLLESVLNYLREVLQQAGEAREFRDRHLHYCLALAEAAQTRREANPESNWQACLDDELENLRAAQRWSLESGAVDAAVRLALALGPYWRHRGYYQEGRHWLRAVCEHHTQPDPARAKALLLLATLTRLQGDMVEAQRICDDVLVQARQLHDHAIEAAALENLGWTTEKGDRSNAVRFFEESLAVARQIDDKRSMGRLLVTLAQLAREDAELAQATQHLSEALALLRASDDRLGISEALNGLAEIESLKGNYPRTAALLAESMALAADSGSAHDLAWIHCSLAENCWHRGDFAAALHHGECALALFVELDSRLGQAIVSHHLGLAALELGRLDQAMSHLQAGLVHSLAQRLDFMIARCLAGVSAVLLREGRTIEAVKILGSAMLVLTAEAGKLAPADRAYCDATIARCRDELEPASFETAWCVGQSMSVRSCALLQSLLQPPHRPASATAGTSSDQVETGRTHSSERRSM